MDKSKKTVLVVDDEADVTTYISTLLQDHDFAAVTARDGEEALTRVKESPPDLITLDITMPEKSGVRFYREMKESDDWKKIPIVIVTGISGEFEKFISTRKQVPPPEGYISKPFQAEEILQMVRKLTA